ncbi:MAG: S-layer homology domain-containing protein, partial [Candidatus Woesearchaeota archaeon]
MNWAKFSKTILGFTIIAIFLAFSNLYAIADEEMATQEPQSAFADVDVGAKNYIAIKYLKDNGIINGYEDNTFKPKAEINRAEALKIIAKATGMFNEEKYTEDENPINIFSDVGTQDWFYKYIKVAKRNNIINGYEDGSFKPESIVNLVEALKILINSDETININSVENVDFADTDSEGWYIKYVSYAASKNMLNINNDNTIDPSQLLTRGYLAEIIYRYLMTKNSTN